MNTYIAYQPQVPPNCAQCGHELHDSWEGMQHRIGKHGYRTWTIDDGERAVKAANLPIPRPKTPA